MRSIPRSSVARRHISIHYKRWHLGRRGIQGGSILKVDRLCVKAERKYGKITPSTNSKGKNKGGVYRISLKENEPRGPKIKGWFLRHRVLSSAGEFWGFLIWKGEILSERKYGQTIGTKVVTQATRGFANFIQGILIKV